MLQAILSAPSLMAPVLDKVPSKALPLGKEDNVLESLVAMKKSPLWNRHHHLACDCLCLAEGALRLRYGQYVKGLQVHQFCHLL